MKNRNNLSIIQLHTAEFSCKLEGRILEKSVNTIVCGLFFNCVNKLQKKMKTGVDNGERECYTSICCSEMALKRQGNEIVSKK